MRRGELDWGRVLRQGGACFMATAAVCTLALGAGAGAASGETGALVSQGETAQALLRAEMGVQGPSDRLLDGLDFLERMAVGESALLSGLGADNGGTLWVEDGGESLPIATGEPLEEETAPPATTTAPDSIVPRTLAPASASGYVCAGGLYLYNTTDLEVDLAAAVSAPVDIRMEAAEEGPQILIVHTHGSEAYTPDGADIYTPSDQNARTLETQYNVVRVGNEMKEVFEEMGLSVVHDEALYDYPQYNGAYSRSGVSISAYLEQYPTISIVLDVHRDALVGEDGTVYKAVTEIDGQQTAQVMLVLGSGSEHPNYLENLTLAARIQKRLDTLYPTLARPMTLRGSVYNQNLTPGSLLVEVGTHGNTLQEALRAARYFAQAAGQVLLELEQ